jgi:hypothetical protein
MRLSKFGWQPITWLVWLRSGIYTWRGMRGYRHGPGSKSAVTYILGLQSEAILLVRLHGSGTVTEYVEKILSLLAHNDPLSTRQQVQLFTSGLSDLLQVDVEMQKPLDLQIAMSLARSYEQRSAIIAAACNEKSSTTVGQQQGMSLNGTVSVGEERTLRILTTAEMAERREKGLCFNCDEKFSRGHSCQRLFYLEVIDDAEEKDPL